MPPASASSAERHTQRGVTLGEYAVWQGARGVGGRCYMDAAAKFLDRWPEPQSFADEPLALQLVAKTRTRTFISFLVLTDRLRPGYDYLVQRRFDSLLERARWSRMAPDLRRFSAAASALGFSVHIGKWAAERVAVRLMIETGGPLDRITHADLRALEVAFRKRAAVRGQSGRNDLGLLHAAWAILYHLGVVEVTAPNRRRRDHDDQTYHFWGVPGWLATVFNEYTKLLRATHAPGTINGTAIRLAHFGRHLAAIDPPLDSLAGLDRRQHVETYLTAIAEACRPDGAPISVGEQRARVITLSRFLADLAEWGWPDSPERRLVFRRDVPRQPRALPRYLPPDADRRLSEALVASPNRIFADPLLLARATGVRIGELLDLELDCVHEVPGAGHWLKVPLGKLATERMVPLDEVALAIVDRIVATRSPGRPLPHPRTGRLADFLLTHQGKRISGQTLRDELARAAASAGLPRVTPHQLRHTYATAMVNAGVSLQSLMALLGHVSAAMSLRYGRMFDASVRAEYERALALAKGQFGTLPSSSVQLPMGDPVAAVGWRDAPAIKSRLTGGFCLRAPAQGACPYANICEHCPNFRTDPGFLSVLGAQLVDAKTLATDAEGRGWGEEAARHRRLVERLEALLSSAETASA